MATYTNIAAYKFAPLQNLKPLRERLSALCKEWRLRGTILLSTEGINLFVAGARTVIDLLLQELRSVPGLEQFDVKFSESDEQPFRRMLVKIKREIIAFGVDGIDPARDPSPKLPSQELKRWLDEGRPIVLLDTRNDYEVQLGTFQNAVHLKIDNFRDFPQAVQKLPETLKQQPIVMFCTGGIRCEKAGPFMQREGFEQIFQLDGGILKYFEECGADHYTGECFVFDQRVGVDPSLHETETTQCYFCQSPLSPEDRADARFIEGKSCPYCFQSPDDLRDRTLAERHEALRLLVTPLPGSQPYENHRPLNVPAEFDGQTMLNFLSTIFSHVPPEDWKRACDEGRLRRRTIPRSRRVSEPEFSTPTVSTPVGSDEIVRAGAQYFHVLPAAPEPDVNANIRIIHEDEAILVVHKPAPLPMHPCGRFNRNTLQHLLSQLYFPQSPRPAHRLDANTTGLVLFSRTRHFARQLQAQFDSKQGGGIEKRYLARVQGHPTQDTFRCDLPIQDDASELGSRQVDLEHGVPASTEFRVLSRDPEGTSLLEVIPITGRTNQIRVHLWHLDYPICGDPTYLPGRKLGDTQTASLDSPPLCLFAHRISLTHPLTRQRVVYEAEPPVWVTR